MTSAAVQMNSISFRPVTNPQSEMDRITRLSYWYDADANAWNIRERTASDDVTDYQVATREDVAYVIDAIERAR